MLYKIIIISFFLLITISNISAQSPRKYAFKSSKDTTSYTQGQTLYHLNGIYRTWNGSKFMLGFYEGKLLDTNSQRKHLSEAVYDTIIYRYLHKKKFGFYTVKKDNKWGLLKEDKSVWVELKYDKINYNTHVKKYYISIENNGKYGMLDENGTLILEAIYEDIMYDGHFYKVIKDNAMGIIGAKGEKLIPVCFQNILYHKKFEYQQVQKNNKWSIFNWIKDNPCEPKLAFDQIENIRQFFVVRNDKKYGLLDIDGKEILPIEYDYMSPFFSKFLGTLIVGKNGKVGLIRVDSAGNTTTEIPIEYHDIWVEQSTHKLKVKLNDKIDYYFDNQTLYDLKYNDVVYYDRINICMVKKGNKWGMYSPQGEEIAPIIYTKIHLMDKHQLLIQKGDKWGVMTVTGKEIIPPIYDEFDFRPKKNIFFVKKKNLWGIISLRGGVILPAKYEDMVALPNKKFLVKQKGLWGIAAPGGRVIVPLQYSSYKYKYKNTQILLVSPKGQSKKYTLR